MKPGICILLLSAMTLTSSFSANSQSAPMNKPSAWVGITIGSTKDGASKELLNEYATIVSKYGNKGEQWWTKFEQNISLEDRNRLEQIFKQMSIEQQEKQQVAFIKPPQPLKKLVPTAKELDSWKNANMFGVWIDGKKVDNSLLHSYTNTDFEYVKVSKLHGAAKRNKTYSYQINLMTKNSYRSHYTQTKANQKNQIVFRG